MGEAPGAAMSDMVCGFWWFVDLLKIFMDFDAVESHSKI
jgi:hypothetical protein